MTELAPYIVGAAMTRFGKSPLGLTELVEEAVVGALRDAAMSPDEIDLVVFSNAVGGLLQGQEMIRGQVSLRGTGLLGKAIINVENACASGSTALAIAGMAIRSATAQRVLVVGAEKLVVHDKSATFAAIGSARDMNRTDADDDSGRSPFMDIYAEEAKEYMSRSGATVADFAAVSVKNRAHGALNPLAQFGTETSVGEVLASRLVVDPLHLQMCSPISDGAAALVITAAPEASGRAIKVRASAVSSGTDRRTSGLDSASTRAARRAYEQAGIDPSEVNVAELHDAVASAELYSYEELQLAAPNAGVELLRSGATALGGRLPVNTSGGLIARGHPLGATGCAQLVELVGQLRGANGSRQVENARVALGHNVGGWLGDDGAVACVTLLTREDRP